MRFIRDLTFDTAKLLHRIYKQSRHYQVRQRAHCILLSYEGVTISELMDFFQVSRRTIYNWIDVWKILNKSNCTARNLFRWSITEELHRAMQPKSI